VVDGASLNFWTFGTDVPKHGTAVEVSDETLTLASKENIPVGAFGMWDFPSFAINEGTLYGRGLDDTLMATFISYLMLSISSKGYPHPMDAYMTVGEEDGKTGSKAIAENMDMSRRVLNLEVTGERNTVMCGNGAVCRLVDKKTEFSKKMAKFVNESVGRLQEAMPDLRVQFDYKHEHVGEPPVFHEQGVEVVTLAVPCHNKHNRDSEGCPAPELVHMKDLSSLFIMTAHMIDREVLVR
jgi:putative aminopeptidase FrvX